MKISQQGGDVLFITNLMLGKNIIELLAIDVVTCFRFYCLSCLNPTLRHRFADVRQGGSVMLYVAHQLTNFL